MAQVEPWQDVTPFGVVPEQTLPAPLAAYDGRNSAAGTTGTGAMRHLPTGAGSMVAQDGFYDGTAPEGERDDEETVPVEMLWVTLERQRRETYVWKLAICIVFVIVFTAMTQMFRPVRAFFTAQDSLLEHTARAPFPQASWGKTFYDITSDGDWWEWVETVMLPNALTDKYYNGDSRSTEWGSRFLNTVAMYNTQTAPMRLRQVRVKDNSCDTSSSNSDLARPCWGDFSTSRQYTQAFGNNYGNEFLTGLNRIQGKEGFGRDYGTDAHVVDLPLNKATAMTTVAEMKQGLWLNEQTRAVSIETNWYNANLDLSTYLMLHIDISPGGRFQPYVVINSCRLHIYSNIMDWIRLGLEAIFVVMVVCFWVDLIRTFFSRVIYKKAYLTSWWNIFEILNLLSLLLIIIWRGIYAFQDKKPFEVLSTAIHKERPDLSELVWHFNFPTNFAAYSLVFSYVKLFKCSQFFPSLGLLWRTLEFSAADLAAFLVIFLAFTCSFTFAGHWMFGYSMTEFHNWGQSFTTLFQSLMGGLPYDVMSQESPISASVFTLTWTLMMCLVFTSMFIAILTQWYLQVYEDDDIERKKLIQQVGPQALDGYFKIFLRSLRDHASEKTASETTSAEDEVKRLVILDHAILEAYKEMRNEKPDFIAKDTEWVRQALINGEKKQLSDLALHFRQDKQATKCLEKVQKLKDKVATHNRKNAEDNPVRKYADTTEVEGEEQQKLQKLQVTINRLDEDLKHLRSALAASKSAPNRPNQSHEGYLLRTM
jgi:hypothetical protein